MEELLKQILEEMKSLKSDMGTMKEEMATKVELRAMREEMATKAELQSMRAETRTELQSIRDVMATKDDIAKLDAKIDKIAAIQQEDVKYTLQLIYGKLDDIREDVKSVIELTADHEIRIRNLARRAV